MGLQVDVLWKEKLESSQTAEMLWNLDRKEPPMTIEEIREESDEGDQCSPLPSGSNTDRIFSEPVTEDGKKIARSPPFPFPPIKTLRGEKLANSAKVIETTLREDEGEKEEVKDDNKEALRQDVVPVPRPPSPKPAQSILFPRRNFSNDISRQNGRKISSEETEIRIKPMLLLSKVGANPAKLSVAKLSKKSAHELDSPSDLAISSKLRLMKESLEAPTQLAQILKVESQDRPKQGQNLLPKPMVRSDRFWRNLSKLESHKQAYDISKMRHSLLTDRTSRLRDAKFPLERSNTEGSKPNGDEINNTTSSQTVNGHPINDAPKEKKGVVNGSSKWIQSSLPHFLKPKTKMSHSSFPTVTQRDDFEPFRKLGRANLMSAAHVNQLGEKRASAI